MSESDSRGVRWVFWNDEERRPRAFWRLFAGGVVFLVFAIVVTLVFGLLLVPDAVTNPSLATTVWLTVAQYLTLAALGVGLVAIGWVIDRRTLTDYGLGFDREWWIDLAFGLFLGVAMVTVVFLTELFLGVVTVTGTFTTGESNVLPLAGVTPVLAVVLWLGYFVVQATLEEVIFRGYLLTNIAEGLNGFGGLDARNAILAASAGTAVVFGFVHGSNPGATPLALLNISIYGVFLAAGFFLTDRLAIPIGIHITWNFSVSTLYGFPVSGLSTGVTIIDIEQSGSSLVTGGSFGPEGGLIALFALGIGVGALARWVQYREGPLEIRESVATPTLRWQSAESPDGD